jgi:hypothetical protein
MATYPPPTEDLPVFNKNVFAGIEYDGRYLKIEADTNLYMNGGDIDGVNTLGFEDGTTQSTAFTGLEPGAISLANVLIDGNDALGNTITNLGSLSFSNATTQSTAYDNTITITETNTDAIYYPVFVSGAGLQLDLKADTATTQFSINPNTSDFTVGTTLNLTQDSVAVGKNAGITAQGGSAVAVGLNAGNNTQGGSAVAVGAQAGLTTQGTNATAVGVNAGRTTQGGSAVAIGVNAGYSGQSSSAVAVGNSAGKTTQGVNATAVGVNAGLTTQGGSAVAIGSGAGQTSQGGSAVAIGVNAGNSGQLASAVAIGILAGQTSQGGSATAIGNSAGKTTQGASATAIGQGAGFSSQGGSAVAVGLNAGNSGQLGGALAIGANAGLTTQGVNAVAVGVYAGKTSQGTNAVAIGLNAGNGTTSGQGANSIAIGNNAGVASQLAGSICLNASGSALNPSVAGCFIDPIRLDDDLPVQPVCYNNITKELFYATSAKFVYTINPTTSNQSYASGVPLFTNKWVIQSTNGLTNTGTNGWVSATGRFYSPTTTQYLVILSLQTNSPTLPTTIRFDRYNSAGVIQPQSTRLVFVQFNINNEYLEYSHIAEMDAGDYFQFVGGINNIVVYYDDINQSTTLQVRELL